MKLKYLGTCFVCLRPIDAGKEAQWAQGIGVRHISCGKKADEIEELKKKSFESLVHGDVNAAMEFAEEALDIEPNEKEIFNLAQSVYDKWDFEGAIKLYDRVLEKNPNHIDALTSMASALRFTENPKEAIRCYKKIIKIQPKNTNALEQIIDVYIYEIRDHQKAIPLLKKMLKLFPKSIPIAVRFAACGQYQHALKINEKVLSENPDDIGLMFNKLSWLTELMIEQRLEKDALKILEKYLNLKNDPKFFVDNLKTRFYMRAGKEASAIESHKDVLKEEPETDFDRVIKSNALLAANDHDVTRKFCEENMHRDTITSHLLEIMALTYQREGKLIEALEIFERLQQTNEEKGIIDTNLLRNIFSINEKLGNYDVALSVCMRILDHNRDDKEMLVKVTQMLKKRFKDSTTAFAYLTRLHGLYPNNNNFTMAYANALMEKNDYKSARDLYVNIAEKYDASSDTNDDAKIASVRMAECMLKLGETLDAHTIFHELVKDDKKFKEAWDGLAKAATELGKRNEAERAIKKASNLEKYEFSRDMVEPKHVEIAQLAPSTSSQQPPERSLSKGPNVVQKPTFRFNPKTGMADKGVEKTFVDNIDSLLNVNGGTLQIGFTDGKPTGLFNDLKLFPKKKRNHEEFEKKLCEILQKRLRLLGNFMVSDILRDIRITFPKTHSVYVCEMFIPKSSIPVYVITKNKDEEFYVRQKKELVRLTPNEQTGYIRDHFFEID